MRFRFFAILAALTFFFQTAAFTQSSTGIAYDYANVSYPGATVTSANGINNKNVIVGSYLDSQAVQHGFLLENGRYTAVNFPGASSTQVLGVNDSNDIVGAYQFPGELNFHGFLRRRGRFVSIDDPHATIGTMASGINERGTIVGSYDNAHGFLLEQGSYRTLDAPQLPGEPHQTQLNGISNPGWIAGQVFTGGIWRGFWIADNRLHFVEPAGSTDSQAMGVNGRGDLVGCHDASAGFASLTVQNFPGIFPAEQALRSCASSINFARSIVGSYFTVSNTQGFLAAPALTLHVWSPVEGAAVSNPVHVFGAASGVDPVVRVEVWVNSRKVAEESGRLFDGPLTLPSGNNVQFVVQAIDTQGRIARVVDTLAVR